MQNLKFVALPVPGIIGGTRKNWAVSGYAHAPFSRKFLMGFCSDGRMDPLNVLAKFDIRTFSRSCDNRGYPKKTWAVPGYAHAPFSAKFLMGFCSDGPSECTGQIYFEIRSFSRSRDNWGYPPKLGSPWIRPRSLFSKIFNGLLFGWSL